MAKVLVIPDIHTYYKKAQEILDKFEKEADVTVFLGDYFDQFNDTVEDNIETAKWLLQTQSKSSGRVFVIGNHDIHYMARDATWRCAGYNWNKHLAINDIMEGCNWSKVRFKLHYEVDGVLYTHAGVHPSFIEGNKSSMGSYISLCDGALKSFRNVNKTNRHDRISPLLGAGKSRGGDMEVGGVLWADFNSDMKPGPHYINQVFGHTPMANPECHEYDNGKMVMCIDSYPPLQFPMLVTDGKLPGKILEL